MSATGFSYAQAARGQTTPQVTASIIPSSTAALEAKESTTSSSTPQPTTTSVSVLTNGAAKTASESGSASRKLDSDAGSATDSVTLIGTLVESTSNISLDDATFQAAASDKSGRASTGATRSSSADDSARRTRKPSKATKSGGKEETAVSVESDKEKEPVKTVLAPAPVPAKNIWEERRRELAIKAKLTTAITARPDVPATATNAAGGLAKAKEAKKPNSVPAGQEANTSAETNGFSSAAKPQPRRLSETTRPDQARRNGTRGNRTTDKDAKAAASRNTLPPVQDTTLWPTPDSAAVTTSPESRPRATSEAVEKPDVSDKDVQEEGASAKPRKKGNWITLDYEPAQSFRPPPPGALRGSKPKTGGRGGRDSTSRGGYNGVTNGSTSSERTSSATTSSVDRASDRSKEANGSAAPARSTAQSSNPSKDAAHGREARQPAAATDADKSNESASDYSAGKGDFASRGHHHGNSTNGEVNGHHASHAAQSDRRYSSTRGDHHHHASRDAGAQQAREHQGLNPRDRTEVRGDRPSRGGFRGRGGHGSSASQGHHIPRSTYQANGQRVTGNGTAYGSNGTSTLPPSAAPFSPSAQQFPFANTNNATRSGRATGRAQSVSQPPTYTNNRAQNGVASGARAHPHGLHLPAEFQMQQPFQTLPYPVMEGDHFMVLSKQVEYYFSVENLCKDMFLRKKMDGQGFVPLSVVAGFRRMAELAPSIEFIRAACEQSEKLDYIVDKDHNELIRSRHEWRKFVLPSEQRNEEARGVGPDIRTSIFRSFHSRPAHVFFPSIFTPGGFQGAAPGMFPGPVYAVNGNDQSFHGHDGALADHAPAVNGNGQVNGQVNGQANGLTNGKPRGGESQLSAAVPDFSPTSAGAPMTLEDYQNCPDEQVEKLVVVVASDADAGASEAASSDPSKNAGPNGSHNSSGDKPSGINGVSHSETTQEAPAQGSTAVGVLPPVFLAGKKVEEAYPELRARALEQRQHAKSGETPAGMKHLYRFWSHCLPDKFNVRMYEDFRSSALDDARNAPSNDFGLRQLVRYYNHILIDPTGTRPYPSVFLPHFTEAKELLDAGKKTTANDETRA